MAPSSQTATSGVTCGRPSARTVQIQKSSAVSITWRVSSHPTASEPGSLNRLSISVTGLFMWCLLPAMGLLQHVPQRHRVLAVRGEPRPYIGNPQVVVKLAPLGQDMCDRSRIPLRRGSRQEQAVGRHGSPAPRIGEAAYRINGRLAVPYDRDLQPRLVSRGDALVNQCLNSHLGAFSTHFARLPLTIAADAGVSARVSRANPAKHV